MITPDVRRLLTSVLLAPNGPTRDELKAEIDVIVEDDIGWEYRRIMGCRRLNDDSELVAGHRFQRIHGLI